MYEIDACNKAVLIRNTKFLKKKNSTIEAEIHCVVIARIIFQQFYDIDDLFKLRTYLNISQAK